MTQSNYRQTRFVHELLEGASAPWEIVPGRRHYQLIIAGRRTAVLPRGTTNHPKIQANVAAAVRRRLRELQKGTANI